MGGDFIFVYLPSFDSFLREYRWKYVAKRKQLFQLIKNLDIPIIDIYEAFASHSERLSFFPFRIPGHYNAQGHKVIVQEIIKYLNKNEK